MMIDFCASFVFIWEAGFIADSFISLEDSLLSEPLSKEAS